MIIRDMQLSRFSIPFAAPIRVGGQELNKRDGLLVAVRDDQGHTGWGEAAPLPGLDTISLDQCQEELCPIRKAFADQALNWDSFSLTAPMMGLCPEIPGLNPISAFGVESALAWLGLCSGQWGIAGADELGIAVNGLFVPSPDPDRLPAQAKQLKASGFSTVKIKIGRMDSDDEIRQILELDSLFNHKLALRLDANRSLDFAQYQSYFEALKHLNIEYVEEPLKPEYDFFEAAQIPWPLALDESLESYANLDEPFPKSLGAVILKPGSFQGVHGMAQAMEQLHTQGIKTVLSSSFNNTMGMSMLGLLANQYAPETAHGLDTLKYFSKQMFFHRMQIVDGRMQIPV
ncbi:o-succinylbenzoate synthase [Desulfatibacillum aliphaticivorans]|uniref:o-succinylbenzoate synthase n=1 Tax=Desulfatibacillum aliphaticivorans TaxID=218208 RepID=UPI00040400D7|nr:o-succinylbenzoate synthase [Desulfatibacillum aliphaticivorans]